MQVLNVLTCVRKLAPIASLCSALPPSAGAADTKEERVHSFYYLNTLLTISLAEFFAKSHMISFLLSSFRFYPPLKNDGRRELHFLKTFTWFCAKGRMLSESRPRLSGSKRGRLFEEQSDAVKVSETLCLWLRWRRQPSEGASVRRNEKSVFTERH